MSPEQLGPARPSFSTLFPAPGKEQRKRMDEYGLLLKQVFPLKGKHWEDLPGAIKSLSQVLTQSRGELGGEYLQSPRNMSAYAYYFLPWNLYRLGVLLQGAGDELAFLEKGGTLLDLGSGPLTLPQALWMARPELRAAPLSFTCVDRSKKIMSRGLELFTALAGDSPWRFRLEHAPLFKGITGFRRKADLILAGNVLNEMVWERHTPLEDQVGGLVERMLSKLAESGKALFVEPGTRLGGKLVSLVRLAALGKGLSPAAPCPHAGLCPMLAKTATSWCHFTFPVEDAPDWLKTLSQRARLGKNNIGLSYVLLGPQPESGTGAPMARVLSDIISLPDGGKPMQGRYACSKDGLLLLRGSRAELAPWEQGTLQEYQLQDSRQRDAKSGALYANPAGKTLKKRENTPRS